MMENKASIFVPTTLGAIGALGILLLLLNLSTGTLIVLATGISASGAFLMTFIGPLMYVLSRLIIGRPGAGILVGLVYSITALGFPIMGPPGFVPKLFTGIGYGLVTDIVFSLMGRKDRLASIIAGIASDLLGMTILLLTFRLFLSPEASSKTFAMFFSNLPIVIVIFIILGAAGGYVGWSIYGKIKSRSVIRRLQGEQF